MRRDQVIQPFIDLFDHARYLEIGVSKGRTFHALQAGFKVAVDPKFLFEESSRESAAHYHEVTSDAYFLGLHDSKQLFDVIYLDGLHTFEQTLRDLMNAIEFLRRDGVIVIDDVLPDSYHASLPGQKERNAVANAVAAKDTNWMGDVYRLVYFIQSFLPRFDYAVVKDNHGQLVMWRGDRKAELHVERQVEDIARMEFRHLVLQRGALNILPYAEIRARATEAVSKTRARDYGR